MSPIPLKKPKILLCLIQAACAIGFWCGAADVTLRAAPPAAAGAEAPIGQDGTPVLQAVRKGLSTVHQTLSGVLRTGGRRVEYQMVIDGSELRMHFPKTTGRDPRHMVLKFGERDVTLNVETAEGKKRQPPFEEELFGMGVSYEDLAMRFLYWPASVIEAEERLMVFARCWKIWVPRPAGSKSAYAGVRVWARQADGAFLKSEGYDDKGQVLRRLTVRRLQSIGQFTTLEQLRVESPGRNPDPVYLEVDGEASAQAPK